MKELINNLVNIPNTYPVYKVTSERLLELLPEDLRKLAEHLPQIQFIGADDYFIHYSITPLLRDKNPDKIMQKALDFQRKYMGTDKYKKVRVLTTLDDELSTIHALSLTKTILEKIKEESEKELEKLRNQMQQQGQQQSQGSGQQQMPMPSNLNELLDMAGKGNKQAQTILKQILNTAVNNVLGSKNAQKTLVQAIDRAEKQTRNAEKIISMLPTKQAGKEPGIFEKVIDLSEYITKVIDAEKILSYAEKLFDTLPRFTHIKKKAGRIGDELRGYVTTKKIERALPRELALPDELFYMKLAGNGLLSKEKLMVVEGALYVVIDKSGSMGGHKLVWSRSVALALYKLAQMKRRKYFLRFFDTQVYPDQPITDPIEALDHILKIPASGGTDIDYAITTAVNEIAQTKLREYTNTIILITDGEDDVSTDPRLLLDNNTVLVAVMIDGHNKALMKLAEKTKGQYMRVEPDEKGALRIIQVI